MVVERSTLEVEARAKANLLEPKMHADGTMRPTWDTGHTGTSIEQHTYGYTGEVTVGADTAVYIELGTGERGEAYEFPGKPQGIEYDLSWKRGIPKDPMQGFAFLIPAVEAERPAFEHAVGQLYS